MTFIQQPKSLNIFLLKGDHFHIYYIGGQNEKKSHERKD